MSDYFYTDDSNHVNGPHSSEEILQLRDKGVIYDDTPICKKGDTRWLPLGKKLDLLTAETVQAFNRPNETTENRFNNNADSPSVSTTLELADLPTTCRLIRVVCRLVLCCHIVGILGGIGAGIGSLFKHANPGLGALIGAIAGLIAFVIILNKIENYKEEEDEEDDE